MAIKACDVFGGKEAVEAKVWSVIVDLSKAGIVNSSQLQYDRSGVSQLA
jgi:hypothetical protein